ncbi:MAG: GDP-mannose 4,6-dehydratase [Anaerolineae bacterium]|nr:GDP-mannose 4,6-dehydratase [Anaerolineae bacterium]
MASQETCLVTGVAGFIGSHLAERLLREGYRVVGVDCFTDYYAREIKEHNIQGLLQAPGFTFIEADLGEMDLVSLLEGVSYVFHQAAQAGVRASWGQSFAIYTTLNILNTQKLLEAARQSKLKKFIYASSSSVYGDSDELPLRETTLLRPVSPYGVSKLAGEHLARLYAKNFGVPTVSLRYFTVYGPRQRPDMAFHKFLRAIYTGGTIHIYGDGEQTRDFTFVSDAVEANILAMTRGEPGSYFNIGGGSRVTVNHCLDLLRQITGRDFPVRYETPQHGDVRHTWADTTAARNELGFCPRVSLEEGLRAEDEWFREVILKRFL